MFHPDLREDAELSFVVDHLDAQFRTWRGTGLSLAVVRERHAAKILRRSRNSWLLFPMGFIPSQPTSHD
jgi:hypothetical protein